MHQGTSQRGFTLIEVLVATTIVAIVMVVATAMLLVNFRAQRLAQTQLALYTTSRDVVQLFNDHVRTAVIDYDFYATVPADEPEFLAIRDTEGIQTVFWFSEDGGRTQLSICHAADSDALCNPGVPELWSSVTPQNIFFLGGAFMVTPDTQPYTSFSQPPAVDQAPLVIMHMQLGKQDTDTTTAVIQTAVSPRFYVR